eukprot:s4011_g1.t1
MCLFEFSGNVSLKSQTVPLLNPDACLNVFSPTSWFPNLTLDMLMPKATSETSRSNAQFRRSVGDFRVFGAGQSSIRCDAKRCAGCRWTGVLCSESSTPWAPPSFGPWAPELKALPRRTAMRTRPSWGVGRELRFRTQTSKSSESCNVRVCGSCVWLWWPAIQALR